MKKSAYIIFFYGVITITFADSTLNVNGEEIYDGELQMQWNSSILGEGEILKATVNEFTDKLLVNLDKLMKEDGADPMSLPDIEEEIRKKILFVHYKGLLKLTYISVGGLSSLERSGDNAITYDIRTKKARFDLFLKLNRIDFTCQFKAKLPPISSHGRLTGEMKNVNMLATIEIDFERMEASVLGFRITDSGSIKVHFHVGKIINWLMDLIGDAATKIFKSKINKEVDQAVTKAMQKLVDVINQFISDTANVQSVMKALQLPTHVNYDIVNKS